MIDKSSSLRILIKIFLLVTFIIIIFFMEKNFILFGDIETSQISLFLQNRKVSSEAIRLVERCDFMHDCAPVTLLEDTDNLRLLEIISDVRAQSQADFFQSYLISSSPQDLNKPQLCVRMDVTFTDVDNLSAFKAKINTFQRKIAAEVLIVLHEVNLPLIRAEFIMEKYENFDFEKEFEILHEQIESLPCQKLTSPQHCWKLFSCNKKN